MNIAMIVYSHFSRDARVRRYAEYLAGQNHHIDVICLKEDYIPKKNINLLFYPLERWRMGKYWYILEYTLFFFFAVIRISSLFFGRRYSFLHIHNMPDFLVFASIIPKIFGSKVILDIHDTMPEVFSSKYPSRNPNLLLNLIKFTEKISLRYADQVITANENFAELLIARNGNISGKLTVIRNFPDGNIFRLKQIHNRNKKFTLLYMGTVEDRYNLLSAIYAVNRLKDLVSGIEFKIFPKIRNEGKYFENLKSVISKLHLEKVIHIMDPVPLENIASEITVSDLGILLLRKDTFTENIIPVKLLEFIKMEKPVITTKTKALEAFFPVNVLYYLKSNSPLEISNSILRIYRSNNLKNGLKAAERIFNKKNNWEKEKTKYLSLISNFAH